MRSVQSVGIIWSKEEANGVNHLLVVVIIPIVNILRRVNQRRRARVKLLLITIYVKLYEIAQELF